MNPANEGSGRKTNPPAVRAAESGLNHNEKALELQDDRGAPGRAGAQRGWE